jgi:hypothetical protein
MVNHYTQNYKQKIKNAYSTKSHLSKFGTSSSKCIYALIFKTFQLNGTAFGPALLSTVGVVGTSICAIFKLCYA